MKHIYELVLPALAEFGISESFTSAEDRNQQTASKDDRLGDELSSEPEVNVERDGVAHDEKAKGDDEVGGAAHGSGCLEFRPDGAEPIREEVLPTNRTLGVLLDENGQLSRRSARAVGAIPQVSDRRFAFGSEVIPGLVGLEGGEVGSEVHAPSKPCGCR